MFRNLLKQQPEIDKDAIARLLKVDKQALESFEKMYETTLEEVDNGFFSINSKQASKIRKQNNESIDMNSEDLSELTGRIVDEFIYEVENNLQLTGGDSSVEYVSINDINLFPEEVRPQLTGQLMQRDIGQDSYLPVLNNYKQWLETGKEIHYHMFRQGLDILDLDPVMYEIIGTNPNSMGHWLADVNQAAEKLGFFKIPETKVVKIPLPILQLTRLEYASLTPTTLKIVNDFCMKAFDLDVNKRYFIKTGTFSSKFDFRNALVEGPQEVRELGEYLLFIHHQANQMAGPLSSPSIYGVSTTNEWVVREFIDDVEDNPTIYKGMPLHTEYRVFVDFESQDILGVSPYWREDVMKKSFSSGNQDIHKQHDYIIYKMHEEELYRRYNNNVDEVTEEINKMLPHMSLKGQWSIDVMQNGESFYIIDMALASQSALSDCVDKSKLKTVNEDWIPKLNI